MSQDVNAECRAALTGISAYLDGELNAVACQAIERHCRDCAACATLVEGLRETIGLCREAGSTPLPEPVRQRAKASIERLLASEKPSPT
jgi:anti-sigma factor RsiW